MKRISRTPALAVGVVLTLGFGCEQPESTVKPEAPAERGAQSDNEKGVLLRLEIEKGHTVTYYEQTPGSLVIMESMAPGQRTVLRGPAPADGIDLYRRLRPGEVVPAVILEAHERARRAALNAPAGEGAATPPYAFGGQPAATLPPASANAGPVGARQQALVSSSDPAVFVNDNLGCEWGPRWSFCRVNWANGFEAGAYSESATCVVDHYSGNGIRVTLWAAGANTVYDMEAGRIWSWFWGVTGGKLRRRVEITNASGDSFHVGCRWTDTPS
jgi:hypothetical protein